MILSKRDTHTYWIIFILYASVLSFMTGCAVTHHRYREGDNVGQETSLTVEDERRMTQEILPQMSKDYPPVNDPELQSYVSELGMKIVRANNLEGNPYHYSFTVVNVGYVNAFALPAGTIFITAPLIKMAENEAELAGVIGHEIGHVVARHTAERIHQVEKNKTKNLFTTIGGGIIGGVAGYGVGKILCPPGDKECLAKAAVTGTAVGVGGVLLVQKYKFMANSREDEMEADRIGFRVAARAGYSKDKVGKFYEKLLEMEKTQKSKQSALESALQDAFTTHPPSQERVRQMNEMVRDMPPQENPVVNSKGFNRAQQHAAQVKPPKENKK